jgi:hypothetical protein
MRSLNNKDMETSDYADFRVIMQIVRYKFNLCNPCLPAGRCFLIDAIIKIVFRNLFKWLR